MRPDRDKSRAVIVGAARYRRGPDLPPGVPAVADLPAVAANVAAMRRLVTDREHWDLPPEHCTVLLDPQHPQEVYDALARAAHEATDGLLFYYAGHGILAPRDGELYLALADADYTRYYNGVRFDDVRWILKNSVGVQSKVVVLDCCYAGRALSGAMSTGADIGARIRIDGTYLMTATAENVLAMSPEGDELTAFTGELLRCIDGGVPDHVEYLTVDRLFYLTRSALAARLLPLPQQREDNGGAAIVLARNRYHDLERGRAVAGGPELVPPGLRGALDAAPALLVETLGELRAAGRDEAVTGVLRATGALRTEQGVAAVVEHLQHRGRPGDAALVIAAAADRRPDSLLTLVETFRETGQPARVAELLTAVARGTTGTLTALVTRLHEAGAEADAAALRDAAVDARIGRPQTMIALVGGLLGAGLPDAVAAVIARAAARGAAPDTLALADALREAGQEPAALQLYATVTDLVLRRPIADVVAVAAAMSAAGRDRDAEALIGRVAAAHPDPAGLGRVLQALWSMDVAVDDVGLVRHLADGPLADLVVALHGDRPATQARRLLLAVLAERPAASTAGMAVVLRRAGLPVEANRLIDAAVARPAAHSATLARLLGDAGDEHGVRRLVERAAGSAPETVAAFLEELEPAQHRFVWPVLGRGGAGRALAVAGRLAGARGDLMLAVLRCVAAAAAPAEIAAALAAGGPIAAEVVLGLAALRHPGADRALEQVTGALTVPGPAADAALTGALGDPAHAVAVLLRVSTPESVRDLCRTAAARDDLVPVVDLLRRPPGAGAHADVLVAQLRARLTDHRIFPVAAALHRHGRAGDAAALLAGRVADVPPGGPDPVALALAELFGRAASALRWSRWRIRRPGQPPAFAGLEPGEPVLHLVDGSALDRGWLLAFTATRVLYARTRPQPYRPWIPYTDLDRVAFTEAGPQTVAVRDDDGSVDSWTVGRGGPPAERVVALLRAVQETVAPVLDLHRRLSVDGRPG
ncbi:caspase family protein [Dactylosporangium vinaceum]|uniref:Caspase family protein n=1 Tax=Dactylosporangium vinaceum TaxID=53362 RepID=A0ABV5ME67_9ACTN|nr:caspase family protein [Dactylosporangium vinaceum]UAB92492.1 caspase family protein [Dactylosporangium vinaceum]